MTPNDTAQPPEIPDDSTPLWARDASLIYSGGGQRYMPKSQPEIPDDEPYVVFHDILPYEDWTLDAQLRGVLKQHPHHVLLNIVRAEVGYTVILKRRDL